MTKDFQLGKLSAQLYASDFCFASVQEQTDYDNFFLNLIPVELEIDPHTILAKRTGAGSCVCFLSVTAVASQGV